MDSSKTSKGKEKDTGLVGVPPLIEDGESTTSAAGSPEINTPISINASINPKQAKKREEMAKLSLAGDESDNEMTEAAVPARPSNPLAAPKAANHPKKQKSHAPRPSFDKPEQLPLDFPDGEAKLTEDQIRTLICQAPGLRKRYQQYFGSTGHLRQAHYNLICEKLPTGELKYGEHILSSNLGSRWESVLQRFQQRQQRRKRKTKVRKVSESVQGGTEPKENHDGLEATLKNLTPREDAARLSTPTSDGLFEPLSETTTAADSGEGPSKEAPRQTTPPLIPSYRSRSPLGPATPSGNVLAGLPAPQYNPFVRPDRRRSHSPRSRSPRGRSATRGEDEPQLDDTAHQNHSMRQYLDSDLMRAIQNYEAGDLDQLATDDLAVFVQVVRRGIAKLDTTLSTACDNSKRLKLRLKVHDLMVKFLSLQLSCFKLQDQLKADRMAE
jgi:hypothetical protein